MEKDFLGEDGLLRLLELIGTEFKKYVKSEEGKGLSTNDFTTELLNKLNSIDPNATGGGGGNGATFTPSVSSDGVLSWTNDKWLPNPAPVNIKGPAGKTPVKGTDYYTETDKTEMVGLVLAALPIGDEVSY